MTQVPLKSPSKPSKSPFMVVQDFISPLLAEQIVDSMDWFVPDEDPHGNPLVMTRFHEESEDLIFDKFEPLIPNIETYYNIKYTGTEPMLFEWLPEMTFIAPRCENSAYLKKKWARVKNRDISCILFLSDYQDKVPFDTDYECYGGKLEFPQHGFGFNPQRGTLIMFPSVPHFINTSTQVYAGDLYQVRFHIAANAPFLYDPKEFPGNYHEWLKEYV